MEEDKACAPLPPETLRITKQWNFETCKNKKRKPTSPKKIVNLKYIHIFQNVTPWIKSNQNTINIHWSN